MFKKLLISNLLLLFLTLIVYSGEINNFKEQKLRIPDEPIITNYSNQVPEISKQAMVTPVAKSPLQGIIIGSTDYDYGFNSGATQSLVTYSNGTKAHMTFMERDNTLPAPNNNRAQKYVYYDGTNLVTGYPRPKAVAASGFGGIDAFQSGDAANFGLVVGHAPCWFAIDNAPGSGNFSTSLVPNRLNNDPEITADNGRQRLWYYDTGVPSRTKYSVLKSDDFGTTWDLIDSNLVRHVTPPDVFVIGALDVPILVAPNGNIAVVTTIEGTGAIAPVGSAHPDSADRIGYFLSTDAGLTWNFTTLGVDGDLKIIGNDSLYILFENFGQHTGVYDDNNNLHIVTNGYMLKIINDTTVENYFGTLYWKTGQTGWKLISKTEDLHIPDYDTYTRNGNALGFSYPSVAIEPGGNSVFAVWSQPRIVGGRIDTAANGICNYDVWYNSSANNGSAWGTATKLDNSNGGLFTYAARHISPAGTPTMRRAHIVYLADTSAGSFVFGSGPRAMVDWIYRQIDFTPGAVSVRDEQSIPMNFSLNQNYPNPFNPSTNIEYSISKDAFVSIKVYNIIGQEVAVLVNEQKSPGNYTVNLDASKLTSGVYIYTMKADRFVASKRMVLVK